MGVWACVGLAEIISVQIAIEAKQRELLVGRMRSSEWIVFGMKLSGDPALREGRIGFLCEAFARRGATEGIGDRCPELKPRHVYPRGPYVKGYILIPHE